MMSAMDWLSPRALRFNSAMGILAIGLVFAQFFGAVNFNWILADSGLQFLVINLIFLGTIHVGLTALLIRFSPRFQQRFAVVRHKFAWFVPALGLITLGSLFAFSTRYAFDGSHQFVIFFGLLAPAFHSISQQKGLCLSLLKRAEGTKSVRTLWKISIGYLIVAKLGLYFVENSLLKSAVIGSAFLIFAALLIRSFQILRKVPDQGWAPYAFHLRLLLYPLILFNNTAGLLWACLHGVEYASVVMTQIEWRDAFVPARRALFSGTVILSVVGMTFVSIHQAVTNLPAVLIDAVLATSVLVHYFVDGYLFRAPGYYVLSEAQQAGAHALGHILIPSPINDAIDQIMPYRDEGQKREQVY